MEDFLNVVIKSEPEEHFTLNFSDFEDFKESPQEQTQQSPSPPPAVEVKEEPKPLKLLKLDPNLALNFIKQEPEEPQEPAVLKKFIRTETVVRRVFYPNNYVSKTNFQLLKPCKVVKIEPEKLAKFKVCRFPKKDEVDPTHKYHSPKIEKTEKKGPIIIHYPQEYTIANVGTREQSYSKDNEQVKVRCKICGIDFNEDMLSLHFLKMHTNEMTYTCKYCPEYFNKRYLLFEHLKRHENMMKTTVVKQHLDITFYCKYCPMTFRAKHLMLDHVQCHESFYTTTCALCGKFFSSRKYLKEHTELCHPDKEQQKLGCNKCSYSTHNIKCFRSHQKTHLRHEEKLKRLKTRSNWIKCEECFIVFNTQESFDSHVIIHQKL